MKHAMLALLLSLIASPSFASTPDVRRPTHVGTWQGDTVEWHSTYFRVRRADWRLDFATPLPAGTRVELADAAGWDDAATLDLVEDSMGRVVGVQHRGLATHAELRTRLPPGHVEPPLTPDVVHRLVLRGARADAPVPPLQAHLRHVRHTQVTPDDIDAFAATSELPIYVIADAAYIASGGLAASVRPDERVREERTMALGIGFVGFVVVLLGFATQLSRRARREQLVA